MKIQNVRLQIVRENIGEYNDYDFKVNSPTSVVNVIVTVFDTLKYDTQENFGALFLNTRNKVIGAELITRGTSDSSLVSPRDIIQKALIIGATRLIVFHNHPSGDTTPSKEDMDITKRLKDSCNIMGIDLLDHIIIGDDYTSLKEDGSM